jgi:hypothetical protein
MSVWGSGSGCQVAGSQLGTARRGLCSSAAPAAYPVPPNRIYFHHSHPRTSSIKMSIEHIFILDHMQDVFVTNIVYNDRMGRAVSLKNSGIDRSLKKLNIGTVLKCMPLEECMFVHCFKVQILDVSFLRNLCMSSLTNCASVRVNICRTGVINFFVGLPGGIPLSLEPELRIMKLCQILLESILGST